MGISSSRSRERPSLPPPPPLAGHEDLRCGGFPRLHAPQRACAVVGSSDLLRLQPMGPEIDRYNMVWRINSAPTSGFESLVGSRTSVRVFNHVAADVWRGRIKPKKWEFAGKGAEFPPSLCDANSSTLCVTVDPPAHPTMLATRSNPCGRRASTGRVAVAMALKACDTVSVFGFFPDCCGPGDHWMDGMRYKYFHTDNSSWVCCARGREDMQSELAALAVHPRVRVRHVTLKRHVDWPRRCAVVGSAHAPALHFGPRIDGFDAVFRVNHAPASSAYRARIGARTNVRTLGDGTLRLILKANASSPERLHKLCGWPTRCFFLAKYAHKQRYHSTSLRALERVRIRHGVAIDVADANFTLRALLFKAQFSRKPFYKVTLSGGLATALWAYEQCSLVEVFLMETTRNESCCVRKERYAYYKNGTCCDPSRETRDEERAWESLKALGVVVHPVG